MVKAITTDLKKIFGDFHVYLCMLALGAVFAISYGELIREQGHFFNFTSVYGMMTGGTLRLFCFLICIVGGVYLHCTKERHGYVYYTIQRTNVKIYTISKLLTSFLSGFVTSMVGFIINTVVIILLTYISYEDKSLIWPTSVELELYLWEIVLFCMLCGVLAAIGFVVATFYANFYVAVTAPIILYYALLSLYDWFNMPMAFQISKVYLSVGFIDTPCLHQFIYACLYTACHIVIFYKIAIGRIQRRVEHA